jgi:hypothetical protein
MVHLETKREEPMLDCLLDYLRVVPNYNFIVTAIAIAMFIRWLGAKNRQWRLEGLLRRVWEKRNKEIRYKKIQKGTQDQGLIENKS